MAKGFLLKMRTRMFARPHKMKQKKGTTELKKLEAIEQKLENVNQEVMEEIDKLQDIEYDKEKHAKHEFSWIKGRFTILFLEDFVGAAFGALFFVVTQEVCDLSSKLQPLNLFFIFLLSVLFGFSLIFFSRRRKRLSL